MTYTFTIESDTLQAQNLVELLKTFDFVSFKKEKKRKSPLEKNSQTGLVFEEESKEDYDLIMDLSKKTNRNIARKLAKAKGLDLDFKSQDI